jgi:hypothetical protein
VTVVNKKSREKRSSRLPRESAQARHYSRIQAASPAGESFSPYPSVWGFVDWMAL